MPEGMKRVFATGLTESFTDDREGVGTLRREGNKLYKYVKAVGGTGDVAFAKGDVLFYKDYSASEATADLSDSQTVTAGIAQFARTAGETKFGWVLVKGYYKPLNTDVVAGSAGQVLTAVGASDKTLDVIAADTSPAEAILLDATSSNQAVIMDAVR